MARTSTYLNFPGTCEEAFNFYKGIFGGEFIGEISRYSDIPESAEMPPMPDSDRQMVIHMELAITGGHVIMGSDAPESMGFSVKQGNNMHLNLEPDTRAETERIFNSLSEGGKVGMPLQDMFWGAYFGSCTDKYGIQWMVNCTEQK